MADLNETNFCPFLELPAELRNTIYSYVLDNFFYDPADISDWRNLLPDQPVTEVNRQVRSKCLSLCQQIRKREWNDSAWTLTVDSQFADELYRDDILHKVRSLPQSARIQRFLVWFRFPDTRLEVRPSIVFNFIINHEGKAEQYFYPNWQPRMVR